MKDNNDEPKRMYGGWMQTEAQIEKAKEDARRRYRENREKILEQKKEYNKQNRDKIRERKRLHRIDNAEKYSERNRKYYLANSSKIKTRQANYEKKRLSIDPSFKALKNMRRRLSLAVHDQGTMKVDTSMKLFGCSAEVLKKHLEAQFTDGMTWDNYGIHGWHIDHIKPCASFDLTLDEEQRKCFHYSNLQPLWAEDNWKKSDKAEFTTK